MKILSIKTLSTEELEDFSILSVVSSGAKIWKDKDGNLHQEDGPALEYSNGTKCWYQHGKCHRDNGPAAEYADGTKYWFLNGKLHREDGPAIELPNGDKAWYLNGRKLSEDKSKFLGKMK